MDERTFEGTIVLGKLAAIGLVDEFLEAVDADDTARATRLMPRAAIDAATIAVVLTMMEAADGP